MGYAPRCGRAMNVLTLFEIFLVVVCVYSLFSLDGASRYSLVLACLFCLFWVQKLERKERENDEARRRLLEYRLKKHRNEIYRRGGSARPPRATASPGDPGPAVEGDAAVTTAD